MGFCTTATNSVTNKFIKKRGCIMETISVVRFRTADGKVFESEKEGYEHEQKLLKEYAEKLVKGMTKEQVQILQSIVDRNPSNTTCFAYELTQAVSRECFGALKGLV